MKAAHIFLWILALFAPVVCVCAPAMAAKISDLDPAKTYKSADITISGNQSFSDQDLLSVIQTKTRPFYQFWKPRPDFMPDTFKDDIGRIERFYQSNGYYDAQVNYDLDVKGNLVTAHIRISEGKPVKVAAIYINVEGNAPPPNAIEPSFKLPLQKGRIFQESKYQIEQQQILNLYMRNGYAHAHVTRRAQVFAGPRLAYVWYTVFPDHRGVFGNTVVEGTHNVNPVLVTRELTYKPGQLFDSRKIAESRTKVVALNLFSTVEFLPQEDSANPGIVPIEIKVHEKPKHSVSLMLGYNTESQFNVGIGWNDYNFLGGGRQFTLSATYSNIISSLDAKLLQPYFFSPKSTLVLRATQDQEIYQTYTLNASRFDPLETYAFTPHMSASFGWRIEYLKFNSLNSQTIAALGGIRRDGILSGPAAYFVYNSTEDPMDPHHGEIITLQANAADDIFGSDYRYWRTVGELKHYNPLPYQFVFAARLKLGFADTFGPRRDIPLSERFWSGGEGSVRGYGLRRIGPLSPANQPLGGLSLLETSIELRRHLFWKIMGAAFFDCGQLSEQPFTVPIHAMQCGFGPAAGVATPVGPVRIDLGIPTRPPHGDSHWQVYFSIGQYF